MVYCSFDSVRRSGGPVLMLLNVDVCVCAAVSATLPTDIIKVNAGVSFHQMVKRLLAPI